MMYTHPHTHSYTQTYAHTHIVKRYLEAHRHTHTRTHTHTGGRYLPRRAALRDCAGHGGPDLRRARAVWPHGAGGTQGGEDEGLRRDRG